VEYEHLVNIVCSLRVGKYLVPSRQVT